MHHPHDTTSNHTANHTTDESRKHISELADRISTKLHALFWVISAFGVLYYTNFLKVALEDTRINRHALNLAIITFLINTIIALYLILYLPYIKKDPSPWEIAAPRAIPTATFVGLVCIIASLSAFWPVYGFLTPFILASLFMGMIFASHFIPFPSSASSTITSSSGRKTE